MVRLSSEVHLIADDKDAKQTIKGMKEYCENAIEEIEDRSEFYVQEGQSAIGFKDIDPKNNGVQCCWDLSGKFKVPTSLLQRVPGWLVVLAAKRATGINGGTNWLGQILTDLVTTAAKNNEESKLLDDEELEEFPYLEVGDVEKYQRVAHLPSRRVIFTHLLPQNLPVSVFKSKAKILLLIRNPKDVATSFYHFTNGLAPLPSYNSWDKFFTAFMNGEIPWGSYFDYVFEWNKHAYDKNVMTITYEELKENRALGVRQISEFFELHLSDEEIQGVVDRSSFQAMKENSAKTHGAFGNVLFRKGGVSDWKKLFNEDHNEKMDLTFEEWLGGTKLGEKLKYEVYCKA
ncbi:hypothetical protein JRQ81_009662 [Phrynocephalus forsythii]|uniref:Sulfotransferase n=1 Tax=Phrynocephalus forsythii TaxID=171643 RepID=A0A9Q1B7J3_9SAUR|nr:hypothetical protein JRQ81_009662 [Phrynocephalus forsythii]